jgi:hypothetical protein
MMRMLLVVALLVGAVAAVEATPPAPGLLHNF